ncbi:MAG: EAL domain-containing protein [Solirubrobacterales bacterium]
MIVPLKTSRFFLRRAVLIGAGALGLLWALVAAEQLREGGSPGLVAIALLGMALTWGLALALRRYQSRLESLAETDPLTDLANHRGFHQALEVALARAHRDEERLAVVIADLDDFKALNDRHGHPYGDRVLIEVARRLRGCVRDSDLAARIGGEEFALLLPGSAGAAAEEVAGRVRRAVAAVETPDAPLTCSAGIAVFPEDARDAATLCELADGAMYSAKRAGKDRIRRFDPERVRHEWSARQGAEIERALSRDRVVESVFQPVISLASGRLVGFEALARFPGFPGRPVPSVFAQAHGCGRGAELEAAAIRAALEPLGRAPGAHLALNVSPSMLANPEIEGALPEDLTDLVIELTEHEVFPDDEALALALRRLRERGARIAIDDTGAGYAGLKQLMRVKPDIVKLDRDLTRAIHADPARMALVESFVRFSRQIGATVCAEGIESLDDLTALAELDVEWGQGYAVAHPAPPWAGIAPKAAATCRAGLAEALRGGSGSAATAPVAGDRRLEHLSAKVANARGRPELEETLALVGAELRAERVSLSAYDAATGRIETLAESIDPTAEPFFPSSDYPLTQTVLSTQEAAQVLVGDPNADPTEVQLMLSYGLRSLLMVPVVRRGESLGLIEAYSVDERPWARSDVNRARIIANQFAAVIEVFLTDRPV